MYQAVIQCQTINKRFEHRSRRSDRIDHIDMPKAGIIIKINRSYPAAHTHISMINNDHCQRTARWQSSFPVLRQFFQTTLKTGIQRSNDFVAFAFTEHHARKQRCQLRHLSGCQPDGLFTRFFYLLTGPHTLRSHPIEHFITCGLGTFRPAIRTQSAGRLW